LRFDFVKNGLWYNQNRRSKGGGKEKIMTRNTNAKNLHGYSYPPCAKAGKSRRTAKESQNTRFCKK
jgi:hypothetical protein